jgi:hypothetical protein
MGEHPAHIILNLKTIEPIELGDFVGTFVALGNDYERFIAARGIQDKSEAKIYVKEVRAGSIEADLIPWISVFAPFITEMDKALIVEDFVRRWSLRLSNLLHGNKADLPSSSGELKDWSRMVEAIANDSDGRATIKAAVFQDGKKDIRAAVEFDTKQARRISAILEEHRKDLETQGADPKTRVLMVFTRSDVNDADINKRSGERVKIEELHDKSLALMYGSELAEHRIKHEIREADENVFKKGFVVDVVVKLRSGAPVAYSVTNVHDVIDLPED